MKSGSLSVYPPDRTFEEVAKCGSKNDLLLLSRWSGGHNIVKSPEI